MNEFEPITASQIDCLVDGELAQVERREVLISLDHDPDGWRRLAMAFLESQAIRDSLQSRNVAAGCTGEWDSYAYWRVCK